MSDNAAIARAIDDMMVLFNKIVREDLDEDSYGFSEMIPLLVQGSLDGQIDSQKLDEYLSIFDNEAVKNKIKDKINSLKVKRSFTKQNYEQSIKMQQEETKRREQAKQKETAQQKQQQKHKHQENSQPTPKNSDHSKKKAKHTEDKEKQKQQKEVPEQIVNEGDEDIVLEKKDNLKKELESQGKQKCRFFPFCKNEETCEFFHPKEKVTNLDAIQEQKNTLEMPA